MSDAGCTRCVLLWNVWRCVPEARALLNATVPFKAADLKGRLSGKDDQGTSMVLLGANK